VPPLIIAAGLGHAHFVELLLRHPEVDVNDSDDEVILDAKCGATIISNCAVFISFVLVWMDGVTLR
jgi:hypothetical protein